MMNVKRKVIDSMKEWYDCSDSTIPITVTKNITATSTGLPGWK
jgi:hypothetical protein